MAIEPAIPTPPLYRSVCGYLDRTSSLGPTGLYSPEYCPFNWYQKQEARSPKPDFWLLSSDFSRFFSWTTGWASVYWIWPGMDWNLARQLTRQGLRPWYPA